MATNRVKIYLNNLILSKSKSKLILDLIWGLIGSVSSRVLLFAQNFIIARSLGVAVYGELGLLRMAVATISSSFSYGINLTSTKYVAEFNKKDPDRVGQIILLVTIIVSFLSILGLSFFVLAPNVLIQAMSLQVSDKTDVQITGFLLVGVMLRMLLQAVLSGFRSFDRITKNNIIYGVLSISLIIIFYKTLGIKQTIIILIFVEVITMLLATYDLSKICRVHRIKFHLGKIKEWPILLKFSLPAYLGTILVMPVLWWIHSQVSSQPNGTSEIGIFNACDQIRLLILFIPQSLAAVFLPVLSETHGEQNFYQYWKVLLLNISANLIIGILLLILIFIFRENILMLFGDEFVNSSEVLVLLSITAIIQSLSIVVGQSIASSGKMWWGVIFNSIFIVSMMICFNNLFSSTAEGLATSYLISYLIMFVFGLGYLLMIYFNSYQKNGAIQKR